MEDDATLDFVGLFVRSSSFLQLASGYENSNKTTRGKLLLLVVDNKQ